MLYLSCIGIVSISSYIADKKNSKFTLFLCAFTLSLMCGLRAVGTGVDTINYHRFMSYIRDSGISFGSDIGFSILSYLMMGIFSNPYHPLVVFSIITNFLIVYRLWDFRKESSYTLMMVMYTVIYYPYAFNIVRQFLAIAIVFWGTKYVESKEYVKYSLLNIVAVTIHTSSIICFVYLFITFGDRIEKRKYKIIGLLSATVFVVLGMFIFKNNILKYLGHLTSTHMTVHAMTLMKIICLVAIIILNNVLNNMQFSINVMGTYVAMKRQIPIMYAVGLALSAIGMKYDFMNRIGFYFIIYELPFWGQTVRARRNAYIYKLLISLIIIYVLVTNITAGPIPDNLFYYQSFLSKVNEY